VSFSVYFTLIAFPARMTLEMSIDLIVKTPTVQTVADEWSF
jgi:hypothetical protein